jgi:hypothetical protein
MTDFLNKQTNELQEYDDQLVRLIEKAKVFDDKLIKSDVEIDL